MSTLFKTAAKLLRRKETPSGAPPNFWPLFIVLGVLIIGTIAGFREFPLKGSLFAWMSANSAYEDGKLLSKQHHRLAAIGKFQEAISKYIDDPRFFRDLGHEYLQSGNLDKACEFYAAALNLNPRDEDTHIDMANARLAQEDLNAARRCVDRVFKLNAANPEAVALHALILQRAGKTDDAAREFSKTQRLPKETGRFWNIAGTYYNSINKKQEAEAAYRQAFLVAPENAAFSATMGMFLQDERRLEDAEFFLGRATVLEPECRAYWTRLGLLQTEQKKYREAAQSFSHACTLDSANWLNWSYMGQAQMGAEQYKSAAESFARATELEPKSIENWDFLIKCILKDGRPPEARMALQRFMSLSRENENNASMWVLMSDLYKRENRPDDSAKAFERAMDLKHANMMSKE